MLKVVFAVLAGCAIFYAGIVVGIKDCKNHYKIPKEKENSKVEESTENT